MMKITALVENLSCDERCQSEHGLSLYIELADQVILSDAGQSDLLLQNSEILHKDLANVSKLFLSHGHYDHSGGILPFCEKNKKAEIYLSKDAFGSFYHKDKDKEKYIGVDSQIGELAQVHLIDGEKETVCIEEGMEVFSGVRGRRLWPEGNKILQIKTDEGFIQDDFSHEIYLVLKDGEKWILISGCAHNGILNILDRFEELYGVEPDVVISGFHMMRKEYGECDLALIRKIGQELKKKKTLFYTGHCTGEVAFAILKDMMGDQVQYLHCGESIEI